MDIIKAVLIEYAPIEELVDYMKKQKGKETMTGKSELFKDNVDEKMINGEDRFITSVTDKIVKKVQETEDQFIFESVSSFCNEITQRIVDKKDLEKALVNYYGNRMTGNEYQKLASRTINQDLDEELQMYHALHGMVGEIGEIHSIFQKIYQGHDPSDEHMKKELGDLLWFIAEFCTALGWELEDVMKMNIEKLKARFPEGFTVDGSLHRKQGDI